ncbi:tetratricopeptide repeat protein [Micromonospora aurantiaca (nom. illeg.)]|uniref:tetratricopeptide repeat protein n=1 Tax=Micromonospora TaxID=1873 RepID=UPI00364A86A9
MATVVSAIGILTFLIALGSTLVGVMRWLRDERGKGEARNSNDPDVSTQFRRTKGPRVLALAAVLLFFFAVVAPAIWMRTGGGPLAGPPTASPMPASPSAAPTSNPSLPTSAWSPIADEGSGGFGSWLLILLGGLFVAVGVGTIVLLYSRRRSESEKEPNATPDTDGGREMNATNSSSILARGRKATQSADNQDPGLERAEEHLQAGRMNEAIYELEILSETRRKALGVDHPGTLTALHSLAFAYKEAGRLEEAIALLQELANYTNPILNSAISLRGRTPWSANDPDRSV